MKVIDIVKPNYDEDKDILPILLKKHISNDIVFEKRFFRIVIDNENPIDFIYRRLWQETYLRRSVVNRTTHDVDGSKYTILVSFAEAITFIRTVTPPVFQPRVDELTESIDNIYDMLCHYLMEENGQLEYHLSVFRKCIAFNPFETQTSYNIKRMCTLRKFNPTGIIIDVEASTCSFEDLYNGKVSGYLCEDDEGDTYWSSSWETVQLMINCHTKDELQKVAELINGSDETIWYVINVFKREDLGYFVECFTSSYETEYDKNIQDIITRTYKPIMEKNK